MKSNLKILQQIVSLYAPFWLEWSEYKFNALSVKDSLVINTLLKNKFKISTTPKSEFYISPKKINRLILKLKNNYSHYQEWVIIRFQFILLKKMCEGNRELLYGIPIQQLPIDAELIEVLLRFKANSLVELFTLYNDKAFKDKIFFAYILKFKARYLQVESIPYESARV
jgi:hypothetical protein